MFRFINNKNKKVSDEAKGKRNQTLEEKNNTTEGKYISLFDKALCGDEQAMEEINITLATKDLTSEEFNCLYTHWENLEKKENANYFLLSGILQHIKINHTNENCYASAIKFYEQAINLNNSDAMNYRGILYQFGLGCEIDYGKAITLYEKAINLQNTRAMNNRAEMYYKGIGGDKDYGKAITLYEQAIALKNSFSMNSRGILYMRGHGSAVNYDKAVTLFEQAIALNNYHAMINLANLYETGRGVDLNYNKAINLYIQAYPEVGLEKKKIVIKQLESLLSNPHTSNYHKFKIQVMVTEIMKDSPKSMTGKLFKSFFNIDYSKPSQFRQVENLLKDIANDKELPLPEMDQIQYSKSLLQKHPNLALTKDYDPQMLNLIGEALLSLGREQVEKGQFTKGVAFYKQVPENSKARLTACYDIVIHTYFQGKKTKTKEIAFEEARPYLDELLIAKDTGGELLFKEIVTDLANMQNEYVLKPKV